MTSRRFKFVYLTLASLLILACAGWWWRAPLLRGVAHWWIVADAPVKADAIVILGGGLEWRSAEAARLYHAGLAPRILVMQPTPTKINQLGLLIDNGAMTRALLQVANIPADAVITLPQVVTSTFDEVRALTEWANQNNAHRFLVPTDMFHTRRARWILRRKLGDPSNDIRMIPVATRYYTADDWWQHEEGLIDFQNEIIKFGMYLCRY